MGEVRYAAKLKKINMEFSYETEKIKYQYKPQQYIVDFTIPVSAKKNSPKIHLEYKGKFDSDSRRKMSAVKRSNPDADIRLVFEKPNNKLYKGAKTRYWEWAEKHGFKWYDVRDIAGLKRDISEAKKHERKNSKATKARNKSQPKGVDSAAPKK